jgi:Protein of unknown function (DUF3025)
VRPWYEKLGGTPCNERLNALAQAANLCTASGRPVRFVEPGIADPYYDVQVFESGRVQTRPDSLHDLFNALAWLAFPRTKATINALHAAALQASEFPREPGRRGRRRDLLTIFDEGGAVVVCEDAELIGMLKAFRWKELFHFQRARVLASMRCVVLGHAVLEQALEPRPGITCKAIFVAPGRDLDAQASAWLDAMPADASPRDLAALPIFGYPGWLAGNERAAFYDDTRYFRPLRKS